MPRHRRNPLGAERFLPYLAIAAKEAREAAGRNVETVAGLVDRRGRTVERFEKMETVPDDPERLMAAYAQVAGLDDPREIYQRALDLWYEHGSMPVLTAKEKAVSRGETFVQDLQSRRARPRARPAPAEKTNATPKRQAGS